MNTKIKVSIIVTTYNQEKWIRKTLDSLLEQKTSYNYEVIIGEDCGSDATRSICEEYDSLYEQIHLLPQSRNLGVTINWLNCVAHCSGEYIMGCAGDDYWHNPNKIQLQVDYMETHPECVLCHTDIDTLHENTGLIEKNTKQSRGIIPPQGRIQKEILAGKEYISAVTMCFRRDIFEKYVPTQKFIELEFPREDWPTLLILSAYGDINYLPISTATYRVGQESITNTLNYDKIRHRYELDYRMTSFLYSMFPEWGPMDDGTIQYYKTHVYHSLLNAAYQNNDFQSAQEFASKDPLKRTWANKMARNKFTFQLFRFYRFFTH